eukprot:scaffold30448_cov63-Phaeocystis_antarctica.AAC.6
MGSGAGWPCTPRACPLLRYPCSAALAGAHLDFELVLRDVHIDPRLEGFVLHALARGLPRAAKHASHMCTVVCTLGVATHLRLRAAS